MVAYLAAEKTGERVEGAEAGLRLPLGEYQVSFIRPSDGSTMETRRLLSREPDGRVRLTFPPFSDDLALKVERFVLKEN